MEKFQFAKKIAVGATAFALALSCVPATVFAATESTYSHSHSAVVRHTGEQSQQSSQTQTGDSGNGQQQEEKDGWITENGYTYYYKDGKTLTGVQKIDGKFYAFGSDGAQIVKPGIQTVEGATVYVMSNGTLKTGWVAVGNKAYYFNKDTGIMAKGTKVKYLKIPKNGNLGKAYALGIKRLNKTGWSLRKAYNYSAKLKYANRSMRKKTSEDYAVVGFTTGKGNCYVMAATFYVQAKLLGYNVHQIAGKVDMPHSWTEIRQGRKTYVYDPNFTNETGRNGYKIRYGQHGTWRYHIQKRMN